MPYPHALSYSIGREAQVEPERIEKALLSLYSLGYDLDTILLTRDQDSEVRLEVRSVWLGAGLPCYLLGTLGRSEFVKLGERTEREVAFELLTSLSLDYPLLPLDCTRLEGPVKVVSKNGQLSCTWGLNKRETVYKQGSVASDHLSRKGFAARIAVESWVTR
uniref:Uncharacterized protein n=1 Tax=Grapevine virus D TaxID=51617 RepID=A0A2L1GU71_9VIRU|nr:Hypothetical protein [Grapevine virus D]